ncbi:hypothetical protein OH786_00010 [Streptomyces atratus]|uniref:hypothetical protein n=1 Tax=Streptomyces atratus TaxID=1893 RepID=UPI00386ECB1F
MRNAGRNAAVTWAIQKLIPEWQIKEIVNFAKAGNTGVQIEALLSNGADVNKLFDAAQVTTSLASVIPGTQLFGTIGTPALYCLQAAWWLDQQLGVQVGTWLKEAIQHKQGTSKTTKPGVTTTKPKTSGDTTHEQLPPGDTGTQPETPNS